MIREEGFRAAEASTLNSTFTIPNEKLLTPLLGQRRQACWLLSARPTMYCLRSAAVIA